MKKITESELKERVNSLREYMNVIESAQTEDAAQVGNIAGQAARTAANIATAPVRGAYELGKSAVNAVGDVASNAWQGIKNFAGGAVQGATQGGLDPLHPIDSAKQAQQSFAQAGQSTQGAHAAKPAAKGATGAKPAGDPEVMKRQQFLKNLGYNIKVDGIWGKETEAAYKAAFPDAPSNQPAGGTTSAPAAATAPGQTYQQAQGTKQDLSKDAAAATGIQNPYATASTPAPAQAAPAQAAPAQAAPAQPGSVFGADGKITGMPAAPAQKKPGVVEFNESDELSRLKQLLK